MKNIFICTDGTWNTTLQIDREQLTFTNVAKLARTILTKDNEQVVYYDRGVGTNDFLDKYTGGAFGHGLFKNVKQAYKFIVEHYAKDDHILIFGFSRGAYTARSLAGLISEVGVLRRKYISDLDSIFKLYRRKKKYKNIISQYTDNFCYPSKEVFFLGVWDTVGALGIPLISLNWLTSWRYKFHNVNLSPHVKNAFHAIALDEKRMQFKPTLWKTENITESQRVEQRWFPGVHSNIGGGYQDSGLSDLTFEWMLNLLGEIVHSIKFDEDYIKENVKPNACGELRESRSGIFLMSKIFPYIRKPLKDEIGKEIIDESVYDRMKNKESNYKPRNVNSK